MNTTTPGIHFGDCLKMLIKDRNITQTQVSEAIKVPLSTINKICIGKRPMRLEVAEYLAKYLDMSFEHLINTQTRCQRELLKSDKVVQKRLAKIKIHECSDTRISHESNMNRYPPTREPMRALYIDALLECDKEPTKERNMISTNEHGMRTVDVDALLECDKEPRHYGHMLLIKTERGGHYIGYQRGDDWFVKGGADMNAEMQLLPEDMKVKGWVVLD